LLFVIFSTVVIILFSYFFYNRLFVIKFELDKKTSQLANEKFFISSISIKIFMILFLFFTLVSFLIFFQIITFINIYFFSAKKKFFRSVLILFFQGYYNYFLGHLWQIKNKKKDMNQKKIKKFFISLLFFIHLILIFSIFVYIVEKNSFFQTLLHFSNKNVHFVKRNIFSCVWIALKLINLQEAMCYISVVSLEIYLFYSGFFLSKLLSYI
jgi:hypothetical protein